MELPDPEQKKLDIQEYLAILRPCWWKVLAGSFAVGCITLLLLFFMPNLFKATAVIAPATDEGNQSPVTGLFDSIGITVGGPSKVEDLEALLRSNDLTVRVFTRHKLWPIVFPEKFDEKRGKLKIGWLERLITGEEEYKAPGDWDAIRAAEESLNITLDKRIGTLSVSFESTFPDGSVKIVSSYLDEAKSRLQEESFAKAKSNKKFIEEQIGKTHDALVKERLYTLYGQEVEREMMARNREQFGFTVIDSPRIPDKKSKPSRLKISATFAVLSFLILCIYFVHLGRRKG